MKLMCLKGKDNVIVDAPSQISPLEPESADKDVFDAILVHHITFKIPASESWLERIGVAMQTEPIVNKLKDQIFQRWPDARRSIPESIHPF